MAVVIHFLSLDVQIMALYLDYLRKFSSVLLFRKIKYGMFILPEQ